MKIINNNIEVFPLMCHCIARIQRERAMGPEPLPIGKSQVALGFLRNAGTDPLPLYKVKLRLEGGTCVPLRKKFVD